MWYPLARGSRDLAGDATGLRNVLMLWFDTVSMTRFSDEAKRALAYAFVALAGGLLVLRGLQEGNTLIAVAGGVLAVVAVNFLVADSGVRE